MPDDLQAKRLDRDGEYVHFQVKCLPGSPLMDVAISGPEWLCKTDLLVILRTIESEINEVSDNG